MVALLDGLEAKRLVERHADAGDRRRNVVEPTEDGRTALDRAVRASDEAEPRLLAELDDSSQNSTTPSPRQADLRHQGR